MKKLHKTLIISLLSIISCQKQEVIEPTVYQIDAEVLPYITRFAAEAKARNVDVKLENLIVELKATKLQEDCAECLLMVGNPQKQRRIAINITDGLCWKDQSDFSKEALVFHELGHCLLGRIQHRNDLLPNGSPASLMNAYNESPYSPCIYDINGSGNCDKRTRRQYYLDELFNEKTPVPAWGK